MIIIVIQIKQGGMHILNPQYGWSGMKQNEPYILTTRPNVGDYVDNRGCHHLVLPQLSVVLAVSKGKPVA